MINLRPWFRPVRIQCRRYERAEEWRKCDREQGAGMRRGCDRGSKDEQWRKTKRKDVLSITPSFYGKSMLRERTRGWLDKMSILIEHAGVALNPTTMILHDAYILCMYWFLHYLSNIQTAIYHFFCRPNIEYLNQFCNHFFIYIPLLFSIIKK